MRTVALLIPALLLVPTDAFAGGVGVMATGGLHAAKAYYYSPSGQQGIDNQNRPNFGGGLEVTIGDSDDRINGLMRLYANTDLPTTIPTVSGIDPADAIYPPAHEQDPRVDGVATMGVQWGLYGDPSRAQLIATTLFGSAFATRDNLEYFIGDIGVGGTYTVNSRYQFVGLISEFNII